MNKMISTIKNPLTIIAIFAGIAEVSGTGVLPFISAANQQMFIFFLIGFPVLLVLLFFLTLNFNNSVLYAPSDFQNEDNYMQVMRFNNSESRTENVTLSVKGQIEIMSEEIDRLRSELSAYKQISRSTGKTSHSVSESRALAIRSFYCQVSYLYRSEEFVEQLILKGYRAKIYNSGESNRLTYQDNKSHAAIWLGKNVSLEIAKDVISAAVDFYKHLKYVFISGDLREDPPDEVHDELYIGGSTETANNFGLQEFSNDDFKSLLASKTIEEFHRIIRSKYGRSSAIN